MIYTLVIVLTVIFIFLFDNYKLKGSKYAYNFLLIILVLVAGLRWKLGGDSLVYQTKFENNIPTLLNMSFNDLFETGFEPGIVFLMSICKTFIVDFWFFQLIHALIINVSMFNFIKKYTPYKFTAVFVYIFFYFLYFNTEILRESLAICIFLVMYPLLEKRNYKKYYLLNILALFFHTSSILLLLIPLFSRVKFNKKGISYLVLLFGVLMIVFTLFPSIINIFLFSDRLAMKYALYADYSFSLIGTIYNFLLFVLFPYLLIKFNLKYGKLNQFEDLFFVYFLIVVLYLSYSGAGRFINYFGPFMLIFYVNTFYNLKNSKKYKSVSSLIIIALLIGPFTYKFLYYDFSYTKISKGAKKIDMYYPYTNIFDKKPEEVNLRKSIAQKLMSSEYNGK